METLLVLGGLGVVIASALLINAAIKGVRRVVAPYVNDSVEALRNASEQMEGWGIGSGPRGASERSSVPGSAAPLSGPVCLVDANGDEHLEVVGFAYIAESHRPTILDGRDGSILWSGSAFASSGTVLCPTRDVFITHASKRFGVTLHSARTPDQARDISLSDVPREWGFGDQCIAIETADRRRVAFSLRGEPRESCASKLQSDVTLTRRSSASVTNACR